VLFYRPEVGGDWLSGRWPVVAMGIKGSSCCIGFREGNRGGTIA
jgi:hypothetical protein